MKYQQRKKRARERCIRSYAVAQYFIGIMHADAIVRCIAAYDADPDEKRKRIAEVIVEAANNNPDRIITRIKQGMA